MNAKKTVLLAIVLVLSVVYLTKVVMPRREYETTQRMAFSKLDEGLIQSIDVARRSPEGPSEERYSLVKSVATGNPAPSTQDKAPSMWTLVGLRGAVVDQEEVKGLVKGLSDLSVEGPLKEKDLDPDLSVYGLDKPALVTTVHEQGDRETEVAFGKKNEYLEKRYVKISGRPGVFLADEQAFGPLNKSSSDVRSKQPFKFLNADVRHVLISSTRGRIKLEQPVVGQWKIVEPEELPASSSAVNELLQTIQELRVAEFIDGAQNELKQYGFSYPRMNISMILKEGSEPEKVSFTLANANARSGEKEDLYFTTSQSDTIFKLASDPSPKLSKDVNDFRERNFVGLTGDQMERVVSSGEGIARVEIVAKGVSWTVNGKESDPEFVEQFLKDVGALRAEQFPEQVPPDAFEKPFLVLTITKNTPEKQSIAVTIGKEAVGTKEPLRYAKVSTSETVYLIRDVEAKRVVPHEEALVLPPTPTTVPATPTGGASAPAGKPS